MSRFPIVTAFLGSLVLVAGLTAAAPAASATSITDLIDDVYSPLLAEYDVPGMAVAVTVGGQRHFVEFGVADRASGAPVVRDTVFETGSVSKTFTAILAGYAEARGALNLSDHPSRHVPELAGAPLDAATLRDLGAYTAGGLPLQVPDWVTADRATQYIRQFVPDAPPGTVRRYSNPSVGLLGQVTAAALGDDFTALMQREVMPAFGLSRSFVNVPEAVMGAYAWGHDKDGRQVRVTPGVYDAEAYGIKSTAADLIRYLEHNIDPDTLNPEMGQAVRTTQAPYVQVGPMTQGLGWEQYPYPVALDRLLAGNSAQMAAEPQPATSVDPHPPGTTRLYNKTGSTAGFGAYVAFVPERRIGLVMLSNKNFPIAARVTAAHAVLEKLAP